MQNAWRFVTDEILRERLKEAKGIGTPATRAEIIKGLKAQNMLAAHSKFVIPTPAGLQLFELLRGAAPVLVDPGTTAIWEMRLDDVVLRKANFRAVIDEIAAEADRVISILRRYTGIQVDLGGKVDRTFTKSKSQAKKSGLSGAAERPKPVKPAARKIKTQSPRSKPAPPAAARSENISATHMLEQPPTARMISFARQLAATKGIALPQGFDTDFDTCRKFLDQNTSE